MMHNRYRGTFYSNNNVKWEVRIMQEAETPFATIGVLRFPYEAPLTIEWPRTEKEDAVCGSMATLTIISPGDRTYEDLYTITAGAIRLDVYRNDALYWSGTLDPEFYEEPYAEYDEYEVSLTFSDFGILDRYKYDLSGLKTLEEIMTYALGKSAINYTAINQQYISTSIEDTPLTIDKLSIRSENFFDEDGEASTLREVIEGILQPLALRMEQRASVIYLYDLHGLYTTAPSVAATWSSTDQMLGVDKVVNNAKITFSVYAESELIEGDIEYDDDAEEEVYIYQDDYAELLQNTVQSFNLHINNSAKGLVEKSADARFFRIEALNDASDAEGVAYSFVSGRTNLASGKAVRHLAHPSEKIEKLLMRTHRVYIPAMELSDAASYRLRITQEMLIDPRYNPFVAAAHGNEQNNYKSINYWFGYVQIPATLTLYNENGVALMHYRNDSIAKNSTIRATNLRDTLGAWHTGPAQWGSCWLSWYKGDDRKESTGVMGWQKNRQNIGLTTKDINAPLLRIGDGQYLPYPPAGGFLELCIYTGIWAFDFGETNWDSASVATRKGLYDMIRWMLYKSPQLELVRSDVMLTTASCDDVEYAGVINQSAKDKIELDTICGTMSTVCPTARGTYFHTLTGYQLKRLTRANRTDTAEQLLIGTLYSQYAHRKTLLSGTAQIITTGLCTCNEAMQPAKKFIVLGDVQDVATDSSELTIVELRPDEYESN